MFHRNDFTGYLYGYGYKIETIFLIVGTRLIEYNPAMFDMTLESVKFGGHAVHKIFDRFDIGVMSKTQIEREFNIDSVSP